MDTRLEADRSASWWVWALALGVSLALHVLLVRLNPNLLLGQTPIREPRARAPREVVTLSPRPERSLDRELPRLLRRLELDEGTTRGPDLDMPAPGGLEPGAFTPEDVEVRTDVAPAPVPDAPEELADPETDWRPRQEVMAITRTRVDETLPFLPRTFRKLERSRPDAPDIRLPDEKPELGGDPGIGGAPETARMAVTARPGTLPGIPDLDFPGPGDGFASPAPPVPDLEARMAEPEPEAPEFAPVEDLLRLQTRVWSDPRDPDYRYFKIQILRNGIESLPVMPREVVFLIDCSASMTERKLRLALRGVRSSLDRLGEADLFTIAAFRKDVERMHPEPLAATVINRARARTFLSDLHAHGKTDVFSSLQMLLDLEPDPGRPVLAMLITDGVPTQGVRDTREILERFTRRNRGDVSVFSMGGGERVNRLLLDFLSYRNRGRALVTEAENGLPVIIEQMARETSRPVLANLRYRFTRGDRVQVFPRQLSHLYLDSPLVLVGRVPVDQPRIGFQMIGRSVDGEHDLVFDVDLASAPRGSSSLRREWAWQALLEEISGLGAEDEADRLRRVRGLIHRYDLEVPAVYRQPFPTNDP